MSYQKLIFMLLFSVSLTAQTFDFNCDPLPAKVIILQDHALGTLDGLFVVINAIEPINGLAGLPVFLNDAEGFVVSSIHLGGTISLVIINIKDQHKLIDKFNNNEPIYLNVKR